MRGWTLLIVLAFVAPTLAVQAEDGLVPQDDAGSGGDAPDGWPSALTILPDTVYDGSSTGRDEDPFDVYRIIASAGQSIELYVDGSVGCYDLLDPNGTRLDTACSYARAPANTGPIQAVIETSGDHYLEISHVTPGAYSMVYAINGSAPDIRIGSVPRAEVDDREPIAWPMPEGCNTNQQGNRFTDACYHMRADVNGIDTPQIDVLILPPASHIPERDMRVMQQSIEMWSDGIHQLAREMNLTWLDEGVRIKVFNGLAPIHTDPVVDPEIVVVATNPVGGAGIGIDPLGAVFGSKTPCHGQANPLASFEHWAALPGFDSHHDDRSGTYTYHCEGGGNICYAVNGAIDPAPGFARIFDLYDLVSHEVGHCLSIGHVGDALDFKANNVPRADIMSYTGRPHLKCVSTLDVETFAIAMSPYLIDQPWTYNDADGSPFQVQHPDDHWYASPSGAAADCPQPDDGLLSLTIDVDDDAGSGRDAPDDISDPITIEPGVVYQGSSVGFPLDTYDYFHFTATAGQEFSGWSDGNSGCYHLYDAEGKRFNGPQGCSQSGAPINDGPLEMTLPYTGDYYLRLTHLTAGYYQVGFALDEEAPDVRLVPVP